MFKQYIDEQYSSYHNSVNYFKSNPNCLIEIEHFVMKEILHFIELQLPEIVRDYNEASYLNSFWKNYTPLDRGRSPIGDQYPWIEVGEKVFGSKLSRYFASNFAIKDSGLPSGSDERCIISSQRIKQTLNITDSAWVFIDIKSAGPRDDFNHAVMSPYQVSGSGIWNNIDEGVLNDPIVAKGKLVSHNFLCSLSPVYVLSDKTIAPLTTFVIKPVYKMVNNGIGTIGQPLEKIKIACIPNGILLTQNPNYLQTFPNLFFPGKDDKKKDLRKIRSRVSFEVLENIDLWRVKEIYV